MQVGDLVRFPSNGMVGLVVKVAMIDQQRWYNIAWADGHTGNRLAIELEVINASR